MIFKTWYIEALVILLYNATKIISERLIRVFKTAGQSTPYMGNYICKARKSVNTSWINTCELACAAYWLCTPNQIPIRVNATSHSTGYGICWFIIPKGRSTLTFSLTMWRSDGACQHWQWSLDMLYCDACLKICEIWSVWMIYKGIHVAPPKIWVTSILLINKLYFMKNIQH